MAQHAVTQLTMKDYKADLHPVWCPGCGDFGVVAAIYQALAKLNLDPDNTMVVSGIGCSSRLPGYVNTYSFNAIHGRAIPIATGIKVANPALTVLAVGGDGDGFAIGTQHFVHAARRNVDITYVCMDNSIYGLTKGHVSPTTPTDEVTKTSPYGNIEEPMNPVLMALACGATFIARSFSAEVKTSVELIAQGIEHPGFSFVHLISKGGTALMVAKPTAAIDLPMKALAWEDKEGHVWLTYNSPELLQERHGVPVELTSKLDPVGTLLEQAVQ